MNKQVTVGDGIRAVSLYREAGIEVAGFFIVGYPGETVAAVEQTFALALSPAARRDLVQRALPAARLDALPAPRRARRRPRLERRERDRPSSTPREFDADWLRRRIAETTAAFAEHRRSAPAGSPRLDLERGAQRSPPQERAR